MFQYDYIPKEYEQNLREYKHKGRDESLTYKYVTSYLAEWFVEYVIPPWMAPNLITLLGFLCILVPHVYLYFNYPNIQGDIPNWINLTIGFLHLFYQHMDNCDGKQARKTGNSTALGMLFDHNVDAWVCYLTAMNMASSLQYGETIWTYGIYLVGVLVFFYTTLEAYLTDIMVLPIINGANEGSIVMAFTYIVSGIMGSQFWHQVEPITRLKWHEFTMVSGIIIGIVNLTYIFININKNAIRKNNGIFENSYFFLYIMASGLVLFLNASYAYPNTRVIMNILGFHNTKLMAHLQAAHVSGQQFNQFCKTTFIVFIGLNYITILSYTSQISHESFRQSLLLLSTISFLDYVHVVVNIINQFCRVIKIRPFHIEFKKKQ